MESLNQLEMAQHGWVRTQHGEVRGEAWQHFGGDYFGVTGGVGLG